MSLKIHTEESGTGLLKVQLEGRLDSNSAPELDDALDPIPDVRMIAFDLAGLKFISSAGLRIIFRVRKAIEAAGGKTLVVNAQPQVRKVFDIVAALPSDAIFGSWEELDSYLDRIQQKVVEGE